VWEQLSEDDQAAALDALAQMIAKTVVTETNEEESHD
jgi:hypothetical protein